MLMLMLLLSLSRDYYAIDSVFHVILCQRVYATLADAMP